MFDINLFLDLDFLCNRYVDLLKDNLFYTFLGCISILVLSLIYCAIKSNSIKTVLGILLLLLLIPLVVFACITILEFLLYPPAYASAIMKDFLISKYELTVIRYELLLNLVIAFVNSFVYIWLISRLIKKL